MYLGIVLIGAMHGLILLPVVLSFVGKDMNTSFNENNAFEIHLELILFHLLASFWRFCEIKLKQNRMLHKENPTRCNNESKFIIPYLYETQHVSGNTPPIIRSLKLHWQPLVFHMWKVVAQCT
jgi:hypothetical protein